jgi:UDP-galactopyranose mutase
MTYDIVIVGAGISGATVAERYATQKDKRVLILEKRNHIAGNCYDYFNEHGILVSKYGPHVFHTSHEDVWEYVNRFSEWRPYTHKVVSSVDGRLVPVPVNITTVNRLLNLNIKSEREMIGWLKEHRQTIESPQNSEEVALSRVGPVLYEKIFKQYTKKQWDALPYELAPSVIGRIPVRTNFDDRYFSDTHQALPENGYTKLFERMLDHPNVTVELNTDYFALKHEIKCYEKLFFTGRIDQFFADKYLTKLPYRSLRFEFETYDIEYYQENSVINHPNQHEFTRIVEYKHLTGQRHAKTTISREYPTWEGEPYYPVPTKRNQELYGQYKKEAEKSERDGVYFVGRLANYKYFNMDQAFKNALDLFVKLNP